VSGAYAVSSRLISLTQVATEYEPSEHQLQHRS